MKTLTYQAYRWLACGAVLVLALQACARDYVGEDPPTDRLHFPTGIAIDPVNQIGLVASSNFDLGYNRGAVHALDLQAIHTRLAAASGAIEDPIDDGVIRSAALISSFAGPIQLDQSGRHAFLANRDDNTLIEIELHGAGGDLRLSCGDRGDTPQDCTEGDHVAQLMGRDAYSIHVANDGPDGSQVYCGNLSDGLVHVVNARYDKVGDDRLTVPQTLETSLTSAAGLALLDGTGVSPGYLLVAGGLDTSDSRFALLRYFAQPISQGQVPGELLLTVADQALDARDVALSPDGQRAYVLQRNPDSVAAINLGTEAGLPRFRPAVVQSVGSRPTAMVVDPGAAGAPAVLVTCFGDNTLYALDEATLGVRAILDDVGRGPADIAIDATRGLAYVTLFAEDTIAVVELERDGSPGLEVVARIGKPRPLPEPGISLDPFSYF